MKESEKLIVKNHAPALIDILEDPDHAAVWFKEQGFFSKSNYESIKSISHIAEKRSKILDFLKIADKGFEGLLNYLNAESKMEMYQTLLRDSGQSDPSLTTAVTSASVRRTGHEGLSDDRIYEIMRKGRNGDNYRLLLTKVRADILARQMANLDDDFRHALTTDRYSAGEKMAKLLENLGRCPAGAVKEFADILRAEYPHVYSQIF